MFNNLEKILLEIISKKPQTKAQFDDARRKSANALKTTQPSNRNLLKVYQELVKKKSLTRDPNFEKLMRKADIRTLSGVAIVTSLTKPYACPGKCVYCPDEARMPKSYLSSEPAAARALALKFDPYEQMQRRIKMLEQSGHPTDKIEYIIKGGSWNFYPLKYQYWFILESFRACNDLTRRKPISHPERSGAESKDPLHKIQKELEKEQNYNDKTAKYKIIGLTLETRPDLITPQSILHMREQGCTRIELGLQAPDDKILELTKRGHTVQQFKDAMLLLRQAGFKVDLHFMPDLPGTTPKHDVEMYKSLFSDPGFKPDMVKIYPCTVIKTAPLNKWFKSGRYKPYSSKKLFEALIQMKTETPRYCRISRLIRDIPNPDIEAGNSVTNLREELKKEMNIRSLKCRCLRCREVGHVKSPLEGGVKLFVDEYETTGGTEYFISFEDNKRQVVFGFLRLRLPRQTNQAFIRELHTYGQLVAVGKQNKKASQHKGIGKKLVKEAERIVKKNLPGVASAKMGKKLAVISGVGVRGYYRKLGYRKVGTYMVKKLK